MEQDSQISNADLDAIAATLTDEDIRVRSQALSDAQDDWEAVAAYANPQMPCPECGGAGSVAGGSFSDLCIRCEGKRTIDMPGSPDFVMPPFAELRKAIGAYGDALADKALPDGHRAKRQLALPPASTVPKLDDISNLRTQAAERSRELRGNVVDPKLLAEAAKRDGLTSERGLDDYDDAELAEMESADEVTPPPKTKRRK